jgi:DNA-binding NarL/FixJ family response regulator
MPAVRVVVADDHPLFREGVALLLGLHDDIEVVAQAADGNEAVAAVAEHRPDVVVLDVRMPRCDGWGVLRVLRERGIAVRVLFLTGEIDAPQARLAVASGVRGILGKDCLPAEVADAVLAVARGELVFSARARAALA